MKYLILVQKYKGNVIIIMSLNGWLEVATSKHYNLM